MAILTGQIAKFAFGGALPSGEIWNCNIMLATQGAEVFQSPGDLTLLLPPLTDWFLRPASSIQPAATLTFAKLNQINRGPVGVGLPGGKYTNAGTSVGIEFTPPKVGAGFGDKIPQQLTNVLSWHTDVARGPGAHGRIYPPTTFNLGGGTSIGADGRISLAHAQAMADSGQRFLAELNNATVNLTACVYSHKYNVAQPVSRVSCGRVVDEQRRRRNQLGEDRQFAAAAV